MIYKSMTPLETSSTSQTPGGVNTSFEYDARGNITHVKSTGPGGLISSFDYEYDEMERIAQETAEGADKSWSVRKFTYDAAGMLIETNERTSDGNHKYVYAYDDAGNRIKNTRTGTGENEELTYYLNDVNTENVQVLQESLAGGRTKASYTYGNERLSADFDVPNAYGADTAYYLQDGRGSVSEVTNTKGNVLASYDYGPFGELKEGAPAEEAVFSYNGEEYNPQTQLLYLRARYYDPNAGRFTAEDTYGGNLTNPITQNRYAFANGDPINHVDPSGHAVTKPVSTGLSKVIYDPNKGKTEKTAADLARAVAVAAKPSSNPLKPTTPAAIKSMPNTTNTTNTTTLIPRRPNESYLDYSIRVHTRKSFPQICSAQTKASGVDSSSSIQKNDVHALFTVGTVIGIKATDYQIDAIYHSVDKSIKPIYKSLSYVGIGTDVAVSSFVDAYNNVPPEQIIYNAIGNTAEGASVLFVSTAATSFFTFTLGTATIGSSVPVVGTIAGAVVGVIFYFILEKTNFKETVAELAKLLFEQKPYDDAIYWSDI